MADERNLLVVDDEEVVCQACRRIFSRQGFQVETRTDVRQGLSLATEKDFTMILLDIKMPNMNGIEFLERLREKKPDTPVLIITGYPSIPNAAAAMRLGACDYVTKPFTSEEVTWAVQRILSAHQPAPGEVEEPVAEEPAAEAAEETLFWDEAWLRLSPDGSASVGAVMPGLRGHTITGIRLPRIGEVLYQGLPMAGISLENKATVLIPSPVAGVVAEVNPLVAHRPQLLLSDPCGDGWIACVCTTRHDEIVHCKPRRVLLVNSAPTAQEQADKLGSLGCQVETLVNRDAVLPSLPSHADSVLFIDAKSLGDEGPALVERVNRLAPRMQIVVMGAPGDAREAAYRKHKIFYYAVEPFADNEIADILAGAFHTREMPALKSDKKGPSEPICSISITNRNHHKVQLLASPGLLWGNEGLGYLIGQKLLGQMFPVVITPGETQLTPANILKAAGICDQVMVLLARDSGALAGSLALETKPEFEIDPGSAAGKVSILSVQPDALGGFASLDARTIAAMADLIVFDMASF